jgi:hypothetical protein
MELSLILLTGVGVWSFVLLMAISLCKAAKHGDDIVRPTTRPPRTPLGRTRIHRRDPGA